MPSGGAQLFELLVLAIPIATVAWTVTHEEFFRELREWCTQRSEVCRTVAQRKFFYLFTCEFCFSLYVAGVIVAVTRFRLLYPGWLGYLISLLSLVWIANLYMSLFPRLRLDIKRERVEIANHEQKPNDTNAGARIGGRF
ncbi:MAG: hypothetical protein JWO19_3725 [Bryobacterales bacterium]|nr:hypothetical protein [Bryobacterales bacterium]